MVSKFVFTFFFPSGFLTLGHLMLGCRFYSLRKKAHFFFQLVLERALGRLMLLNKERDFFPASRNGFSSMAWVAS